jgi:hypothetical protein
MRNGPEQRFTAAVSTLNTDTSVVLTVDRDNTQDLGVQSAARTITMTETLTAGWRSGERVEVIIRSLGG